MKKTSHNLHSFLRFGKPEIQEVWIFITDLNLSGFELHSEHGEKT